MSDPTPTGGMPDLDLTHHAAATQERVGWQTQEVPKTSTAWARIVKPFAFIVFGLLALVLMLPFIRLLREPDHKDLLDWAKTILAPVVGFGSAVIGFYFGTSTAASRDNSQDS